MDGPYLRITFKSNERPFSMNHEPYPRNPTREYAIEWARNMADGLHGYTVTLFIDGEPVDYTREK